MRVALKPNTMLAMAMTERFVAAEIGNVEDGKRH
jgi:hypothetical protein